MVDDSEFTSTSVVSRNRLLNQQKCTSCMVTRKSWRIRVAEACGSTATQRDGLLYESRAIGMETSPVLVTDTFLRDSKA